MPNADNSQQGKSVNSEAKMMTLAALPFSNISQQDDIDFLGFALVDEVISSLAYLQNVLVRPSSSVRKYSNTIIDPKEAGLDLSVQYVLMGHYIKAGDSVRLNLELIDILDDIVIWRGSVQERMEDVFKLQDLVAKQVIDGLEVQFSSKERERMTSDVPQSQLAYEYYLKSLSTPYSFEGNQLAIELLHKSIALDSLFSPAHAEIGNRLHFAANNTVMNTRYNEIEKAIDYLERALQLNPESLTALFYLSLVHTELNEMEKAISTARKMIQINQNNSKAHFSLGYAYRYVGLIDEAVEEMATAVRLDPKDNQFRSIAVTYNMAGKYREALTSLVYDDGSGFAESWKAITFIRMAEFDHARQELLKLH